MISKNTILVVDDDPVQRRILGHTLRRLGYVVEECADGVEAFRILEACRGAALLVLDYAMPKFNGAQVCEIIRTHSDPAVAQTPIILLTAHTGEHHEVECLGAGADDFVSKPVNLPVLAARIETHLRVAALRTQLQIQNEQLEQWRETHERDLQAAQIIQRAIIPDRVPKIAGWEFASLYQPLIQVGGDIYDWLPLPCGGLLVWIADATGHGASAALLTTFTKLLFRHAILESVDPVQLLRFVNGEFHSIFGGRLFLTAACVVLRPGNGEIEVAGAGHPPLLIVRTNGTVEALSSTAPPVGLLPKVELVGKSAFLEQGDSLLLFTDGLYAVKNPEKHHFSFDDLLACLKGVPTCSPTGLIERAVTYARDFAQGNAFEDDLAVVGVRRAGN